MHVLRSLGAWFLATATILISPGPMIAQSADIAPAERCYRKVLAEDERPGWTVSGSWIGNQELALVDALKGRLMRYSAQGRLLSSEDDPVQNVLMEKMGTSHPFAVAAGGSTYWVELNADSLAQVTAEGQLAKRVSLKELPIDDDTIVDGVFAWDVAADHVVGFANLREPGDPRNAHWATGFFRVPVGNPSRAELIGQELPDPSPEKFWYRLGMDFVAPIGDTVFVLTVPGKFQLARIDPSSNELLPVGDLPAKLREIPALPSFKTIDDMVPLMMAIEDSTIPAGLHVWENELFLLWRQPEEGITQWYVTKISRETGEAQGTGKLPSSANHLTVVSGEEYWALVEKGPVAGYGSQRVGSIVFMPVEELARIASGAEPVNLCRP